MLARTLRLQQKSCYLLCCVWIIFNHGIKLLTKQTPISGNGDKTLQRRRAGCLQGREIENGRARNPLTPCSVHVLEHVQVWLQIPGDTGYRLQDTGYFIISFLRNLNVVFNASLVIIKRNIKQIHYTTSKDNMFKITLHCITYSKLKNYNSRSQ